MLSRSQLRSRKRIGFFAAAALNDTKKSRDESTYTSYHFTVSFRVKFFFVSFRGEHDSVCVIQSGVCGAKNPGSESRMCTTNAIYKRVMV